MRDAAEWAKRGWCRLEMWSRLAVGGDPLLYEGDGKLTPTSSLGSAWKEALVELTTAGG